MAQMRHVVFIGETGAGKSSIINLCADREYANTSPDAGPCTRDFAPHDVSFEGRTYRLWDTPGLNDSSGFGVFRRSAKTTSLLKKFLRERYHRGELDLLVFCVRGNRAHKTMSNTYKTFVLPTRRFGIPIVIAVTNLERSQPTMDAWWQNNERTFQRLGLVFDGYACLTCLPMHHRRWMSQNDIRFLISTHYRGRTESLLSSWEYLRDDSPCDLGLRFIRGVVLLPAYVLLWTASASLQTIHFLISALYREVAKFLSSGREHLSYIIGNYRVRLSIPVWRHRRWAFQQEVHSVISVEYQQQFLSSGREYLSDPLQPNAE